MRKTYSEYLKELFHGLKVQKISVNAGFTCPNRDGTISTGGCIYCRNDSFSPSYCMERKSVTDQIEDGKQFFHRKYPDMKYLVYFQSFTNTYGRDTEALEKLYREAAVADDVVGLVVGTRPDTLPDSVLDMLSGINREMPVMIEIGAETSNNSTLRLINRNHSWEDVEDAVCRASERGLHCGIHLIAGLPGEESEDVVETVKKTCLIPVRSIKLHQLQILYGTPLYEKWISGNIDVKPLDLNEYLDLCAQLLEIIPEEIVVERFLSQSPAELVAAPKWGLKNYQFVNMLENYIRKKYISIKS